MYILKVALHIVLASELLLAIGVGAEIRTCTGEGVLVRVSMRLEVVSAVEKLATLMALPALDLGYRVDEGRGASRGMSPGGFAGRRMRLSADRADVRGALFDLRVGEVLDGSKSVVTKSVGEGAEQSGLGVLVAEVRLEIFGQEVVLVLGLELGRFSLGLEGGGEGGEGFVVIFLLDLDLTLRGHHGGLGGLEFDLSLLRFELHFSLELDVLEIGSSGADGIVNVGVGGVLKGMVGEERKGVGERIAFEIEVGVVKQGRRYEEVAIRVGRTHRVIVASVERVSMNGRQRRWISSHGWSGGRRRSRHGSVNDRVGSNDGELAGLQHCGGLHVGLDGLDRGREDRCVRYDRRPRVRVVDDDGADWCGGRAERRERGPVTSQEEPLELTEVIGGGGGGVDRLGVGVDGRWRAKGGNTGRRKGECRHGCVVIVRRQNDWWGHGGR